jgi:hypothetical protein
MLMVDLEFIPSAQKKILSNEVRKIPLERFIPVYSPLRT